MLKGISICAISIIFLTVFQISGQPTYFNSNSNKGFKSIKFTKYIDVDGKGNWKFSGLYYIGNFSVDIKHKSKPSASWIFSELYITSIKKLEIHSWIVYSSDYGESISNIANGNEIVTDEKTVLYTMNHTRELPTEMPGLWSLQKKGILNINEEIILKSGVTIGHPVEFTKAMRSIIKKFYFKRIFDGNSFPVKCICWEG